MSGAASLYPIMLDLRGRPVVVIGGGAIAERKVRELVAAGAVVRVISPTVTPELELLAETAGDRVQVTRRAYETGDLHGAVLAIAATDDAGVHSAVWKEAEAERVLLNAVDDVRHCHFIAPSVHREGDITVAVSTAGTCPTLAVRLRERIARIVRPEHAEFARVAGELRASIARRVPTFAARRALWYRIVDSAAVEHLRRGDVDRAHAVIEHLVSLAAGDTTDGFSRRRSGAPRQSGTVHLVGAGPGDPGLITARGLELLRDADVVVHDRLVSPCLLAHARPDACIIAVGKEGYGDSTPQCEINTILVREARRGHVVVRLKGGDPFVFGRGGEEVEALREAGVDVEVVPGVSSAIAVPAAVGIPVTHRAMSSAFAVVTGHENECDDDSEPAVDWSALANVPTLVILMGLRALPNIVSRLQAHGRAPSTAVAVISRGTLPDQRWIVGTLGTIAADAACARLESPATIVVGEVVRLARGCRLDLNDATDLLALGVSYSGSMT